MWRRSTFAILLILCWSAAARAQPAIRPIALHAVRLLDVETGRTLAPGEVLVVGERISEVGTSVTHPAGAEIIDLGDRTLLPGLIDAHIPVQELFIF
jgi:imidazolonepropionase-like amidohydrolase